MHANTWYICIFTFLCSLVTHYDSTFKIWNGETIAALHSISLQCSCSIQICFLISQVNLTYFISHYYNSCSSFSPCHCNSDTKLKLCIFILVKVFQQLWIISTFGNSVIAAGFFLNATIIFPVANITLILDLRHIFPFSSPIVPQ